MLELIGRGAPTAVFCISDEMAIGAMWAAEEAGLRPETWRWWA